MKKKLLIPTFALIGVISLTFGAKMVITSFSKIGANADIDYEFTFGLLTESTSPDTGVYAGTTALGNPVPVNYSGVFKETSGEKSYNYLPQDSYFAIESKALNSITSIKFNKIYTSGIFEIEYGWYDEESSKVVYNYSVEKSAVRDGSFSFDLSDYKPNYIKVVSNNGFAFDSATFKYKCTESVNPFVKTDGFILCDEGTHYRVAGYEGSSTNITLPESYKTKPVTKISEKAFKGISLDSVVIPGSYTTIGEYAFSNCGISSLTLNEGLKTIYGYAFQNNSITSLSIPDTVSDMRACVFYCCYSLSTVNISSNSSLSYVADGAFRSTAITSIYIPANASTWLDTFTHCSNLKEINVDSGNTSYCSEDGIFYNKDKTQLRKYPEGKTATTYNMPSTVKTITSYGLTNEYIKNIQFSKNLETFNTYNQLINVENIDFNDWKVNTLNGYAFSGMLNCTDISIPDSVTEITGYSLSDNAQLTYIYISYTVTSISANSINDNPNLTTVEFGGDTAQWNALGKTDFSGCPNLTQIELADGEFIPVTH